MILQKTTQRFPISAENHNEAHNNHHQEAEMTIPKPRYPELLSRAREMRSNPTDAEARMWEKLRRKQLGGFKFRRQHILNPYIVDFYCSAANLVVEVDGKEHRRGPNKAWDEKRDEYLCETHGVEILRVEAADVFGNLGSVLEEVLERLEELAD
jgi:very-short-patch-repair endonuclease